MKTRPIWICALAAGIVLGAANWTPANGITYWHGKADTNWGNAGNWTDGVADTKTEIARFGAERDNQPRLLSDYDIAALYFYNAGWEIHELGSHSLALWSTSAVHCVSNIGTTYIYSDIELGSDQGWYIGANSTLWVSGVISRSRNLTKNGLGILHLDAANTFDGTMTVAAGMLRMGNSAALPASTDVTVEGGAVLDLNGHTAAIDALDGDGLVTLGSDLLKVGNNDGNGTFSGVISGTGQLYKYGTGTQTLSGANIYTGKTKAYAGTLALGSASDRLSDETDVYVAGGAVFDMNGFNDTVDTLSGDGSVLTDGATLGVGGNNGSAKFAGVISGAGGLQVTGLGVLTLSGTNEYTGVTTVDGTLIVDGSIASSSLTTVNDGGTLGGSGAVGPVELYGTAAPGASSGILTVEGDFTMIAGLIQIELGRPLESEYDRLVVTGLLALDGDLDVLLITGFKAAPGITYDILDWDDLTGTFDNENLPDLAAGLMWDKSDLYTTGEISVVTAPVVPEPAGLGLIGLALLASRRRKS